MEFESEKILLNQVLLNKNENFEVEENIIIPDIKPDILSIVNSCGNVYVYRKELNNGKLKIDGAVQVDVMYLADDEQNNVRAVHSILDFSKIFDVVDGDNCSDFSCKIDIKGIEPKILNGRKISLKVYLDLNVTMFANEEREYVKSIKENSDVQMISNTIKINTLLGSGETVSNAKDTIRITDNLADILTTNIFIKNRDLKVSYNKVLVKADACVDIVYITEDEQINSIKAEIPVMGFIDIPGISDNDICPIEFEFRNIDIKPNNVEDHSISVEIEFLIKCKAYNEKEIYLIQDLYSPKNDISISQNNVKVIQQKKVFNETKCVNEKISIPELKENFVYDIKAISNVVNKNITSNGISYECEMKVAVLYQSSTTNRIEMKTQSINFSYEMNYPGIDKSAVINENISVEKVDFLCLENNLIELNVDINFYVDSFNCNSIEMISNIKVDESNQINNTNSLVIYYVKNGDTLWKIAKRFKSTIDEIAQINGIENVDKINIGDQLFIPRYVGSQI